MDDASPFTHEPEQWRRDYVDRDAAEVELRHESHRTVVAILLDAYRRDQVMRRLENALARLAATEDRTDG